jgi:hypothetical protein
MAERTTDRAADKSAEGGRLGSGGGGANDSTSGSGAGSGIPDGDTAQRAGEAVVRGNTDADRRKLFPESADRPRPDIDVELADDQDNDIPDGAMPPPRGG